MSKVSKQQKYLQDKDDVVENGYEISMQVVMPSFLEIVVEKLQYYTPLDDNNLSCLKNVSDDQI